MARAVGVILALRHHFRPAVDVRIAYQPNRTAADDQMVLCAAFGPRRARVLVDARIDALRVAALLVVRAVVVAAALDHIALHQWVAPVAAQTATFGPIRPPEAFRPDTARVVVETRVDAVAVHARLAGFALRINTASNRTAGHVGIALVAVLARAHRPMVLNRADRIRSAAARIATLSVDASLLLGALRIRRTHTYRCLQHNAPTFSSTVWHVQWWTFAHHRAHWHRVLHRTQRGRGTWAQLVARVEATVSDARHAARTVAIHTALLAFHGTRSAERVRIALRHLLRALALRLVVAHEALRILGAR